MKFKTKNTAIIILLLAVSELKAAEVTHLLCKDKGNTSRMEYWDVDTDNLVVNHMDGDKTIGVWSNGYHNEYVKEDSPNIYCARETTHVVITEKEITTFLIIGKAYLKLGDNPPFGKDCMHITRPYTDLTKYLRTINRSSGTMITETLQMPFSFENNPADKMEFFSDEKYYGPNTLGVVSIEKRLWDCEVLKKRF